MEDKCKTGRVTIPTDLDVVPETLEILKKWGADAIRDCDGTDFPQELKNADAKIRPRQHRDHPSDERHQPGADESKRSR